MSYYGQGDYYAAGGLGSFLGKVARGALGFVTGGPIGAVSAVTGRGRQAAPPGLLLPGVTPAIPLRGPDPTPRHTIPAARPVSIDPITGMVRPKRRRMNYANGKALGRANRRVDGFVRLAKRSLKHTNYKIVSKSAGRSRPKTVIRESGPGGVVVT